MADVLTTLINGIVDQIEKDIEEYQEKETMVNMEIANELKGIKTQIADLNCKIECLTK